jgi:hypothetical protein
LFTGHISSWTTQHSHEAPTNPVRIEAIDPLGYLGTHYLTIALPATSGFARVRDVLDAINWPGAGSTSFTGWRNLITTGSPSLTAKSYTNTSVLSILRECIAPVRGGLSANGDGEIVYHANARTNAVSTTPTTGGGRVYGPTAPQRLYLHAEYTVDRTDVITVARITGATEQVATSTLGQLMPREYRDSLPISDAAALTLAQTLINRYEVPRPGVKRLTFALDSLTSSWHQNAVVQTRPLSPQIEVITASPVGGSEARRYIIEGTEHTIQRERGTRWLITLHLSPAEAA